MLFKQKVTLFISDDLHRQVKIRSAIDGETMSSIAQRAIQFYLGHPDAAKGPSEIHDAQSGKEEQQIKELAGYIEKIDRTERLPLRVFEANSKGPARLIMAGMFAENDLKDDTEQASTYIYQCTARIFEEKLTEALEENDLKDDTEQASTYIDECNARIAEKLAVLDHMETRFRLKMAELEAMVARL
jgi:hypothetical protein